MMESLRKLMYFGLGAAATSADKVRQMVDDLVAKGEVTREEGKKLYDDIMARADEQRKELNERIRGQVADILRDMGVAERSHVARLESRIESLERKVEELVRMSGEEGGPAPGSETVEG